MLRLLLNSKSKNFFIILLLILILSLGYLLGCPQTKVPKPSKGKELNQTKKKSASPKKEKPPAVPPDVKSEEPPKNEPEIPAKVVVIDPGHQAKANLEREPIGPGATETKEKVRGGSRGVVSGTPEYVITLEIALKLKSLLENQGIKVVMTRESHNVNVSNVERAQIANQAQANLFIRIHTDGNNNSSVRGISTLYPAKNSWTTPIYGESLKAARIIQEELIKVTGGPDKGIVPRGDLTGFNWSKVPVVLTEIGFLSNSQDDQLLNSSDYQQKIAQTLSQGILKYLQTS